MSELPPLVPPAEPKLRVDQLYPDEKKTVEEMYPDRPPPPDPLDTLYKLDGVYWDKESSEGELGQTLTRFGYGLKQGWGTRSLGLPEPKDPAAKRNAEVMRDSGFLPDYEKMREKWIKGFNDNLLRGAALVAADVFNPKYLAGTMAVESARAVDVLARLPGAVVHGLAEGLEPVGGHGLGALFEAFPLGHVTGFPGRVRPTAYHELLQRAELLDVIGKSPETVAREAFAPESIPIERPSLATEAPSTSFTEMVPQDVHAAARAIAPETFREYDALTVQRDELTGLLNELRTERDAPAQARIDNILSKVNNVESRLTNRAALRLRLAREELAEIQSVDSPTMEFVRGNRQELEFKMRDLAPEVTKAYKDAYDLMPREEAVAAPVRVPEPVQTSAPITASVTAPTTEIITGPEIFAKYTKTADANTPLVKAGDTYQDIEAASRDIEQKAREIFAAGGKVFINIEGRDRSMVAIGPRGGLIDERGNRWGAAAIITDKNASLKFERPVVELSQRRRTIAQDVESQLVAAGRPAVEARAGAALVQALYETRAARFEGKLGRARDLYESDDFTIQSGQAVKGERGAINFANRVISMMEKSDASSFIHEVGHQWLEVLRKDAQHPAAPQALKDDLQIVEDWLNARKTATGKHEYFARGFERYLMEGQAPTTKLAKIFEQFKQWLTDLYQSVSKLGVVFNDDIRGVYDRLLSRPIEEPVIVPEREGALDAATHAEQVARETPAAQAIDAANRILVDRNRIAESISQGVADARRAARGGGTRISIPEREGVGGEPASPGASAVAADAANDASRGLPTQKSEPPARPTNSFSGPNPRYLDKAGNIRLDTLNTSADVKNAIRDMAGENDGFLTARRGVVSDAEVYSIAEAMGLSVENLDRKAIGEAFSAEEIRAIKKLLEQTAGETHFAMSRAQTGDVDGIIEHELAKARQLLVQEQFSQAASEAGRSLRAFRRLGIEVPSGDIAALGTLLQTYLKTAVEAKRVARGEGLAGDAATVRAMELLKEQIRREAELGMTMDTPSKLNRFIRESDAARDPNWQDKLVEIWINSLLSGPNTHIRNMVGNTTVAFNDIIETAAAAGISAFRREGGVEWAEIQDRISGMRQGTVEGLIAFGKAMRDEGTMFEDSRPIENRMPAIGGTTGQVIRLPTRMLVAEDELFKAIARRQELNVQARRTARLEGLEGDVKEARIAELLNHPTDIMKEAANRHAEYQTFTQDLGKWGQAWLHLVDSHPLMRYFFPFNRTPINMLKYATERTPFGFGMQKVRDNMFGRNGKVAQDTQIARMALGSMFMMGVFTLGYAGIDGLVTGGGPWRSEEQSVWKETGKLPYAVRLGNIWASLQGFEPLSTYFGMAADLADLARYTFKTPDPELDRAAAMLTYAISRDVFNKMQFRSIQGLFSAITDSERSAGKFFRQMASSAVPGIVGQTEQYIDPIVRDAREIVDAALARIPFADKFVLPRQTVFGQEATQARGPLQWNWASNDPTVLALDRLGIHDAMPQRKIEDVELSPQQYYDYAQVAGVQAKEMLDALFQNDGFNAMPAGLQKQEVRATIEDAHRMGKDYVLTKYPDLLEKIVEEKEKVFR